MSRSILQSAVVVFVLLALAASVHAGPQCGEGGGDAGSSRATAKSCSGTGSLGLITGSLSAARDSQAVDFEDMFLIRITDPVNFTARTDAGFGSATFNTELWLFRPDETNKLLAYGLLANDEILGGPAGPSRLRPPATDGTGQTIPGAGLYLLAISGQGNDPRSGGGAIFNQASATEVSGPDGAGGLGAHTSWTGAGPEGTYSIHLVGAALVPPVPALTPLGGAILAMLVAAAGMVVFRRTCAVAA